VKQQTTLLMKSDQIDILAVLIRGTEAILRLMLGNKVLSKVLLNLMRGFMKNRMIIIMIMKSDIP
jgi:hypothetical protein